MSKLNREQAVRLRSALLDSFGDRTGLRAFLRDQLGLEIDRLSTGENLDEIVADVVEHFQERNDVETLLAAAAAERPKVPEFAALHAELARPAVLGAAAAAPRRAGRRAALRPGYSHYTGHARGPRRGSHRASARRHAHL